MMKKFYSFLLAFMVISAAFAQTTVLYVHENDNDQPVMDAIEAHADFTVSALLRPEGTPVSADDLATLNAASLVIIGRSVNSARVDHDLWDQVTAPVIYTSPYVVRGDRAGMVTATSSNSYSDESTVLQAVIDDASNPVFAGVDAGTIDWWTGFHSILVAESGTTNATVLVKTADNQVLMGMWAANVPYQDGGRTPAGPRAYMGNGQDNASPANYFSYSDNAKTIFFNLLTIMANGSGSSVDDMAAGTIKLSAFANNGQISFTMEDLNRVEIYSMDGKLQLQANADSNTLKLNANLKNGLYIAKAYTKNGLTAASRFVVK